MDWKTKPVALGVAGVIYQQRLNLYWNVMGHSAEEQDKWNEKILQTLTTLIYTFTVENAKLTLEMNCLCLVSFYCASNYFHFVF